VRARRWRAEEYGFLFSARADREEEPVRRRRSRSRKSLTAAAARGEVRSAEREFILQFAFRTLQFAIVPARRGSAGASPSQT
jgi:hypothetical protein